MSVVAFIGRDAASNGSFSFLPLNRAFLSRRVYLKSQYYSFSISVVLKSNISSTDFFEGMSSSAAIWHLKCQ